MAMTNRCEFSVVPVQDAEKIVLLPHFVNSQSLNLRLVQASRTAFLGNRVNKGAGLLGD